MEAVKAERSYYDVKEVMEMLGVKRRLRNQINPSS